MDHEVVVRQKITERYLLKELDAAARDEFEEHFFDCPDCAMDVRAASSLVEQAKKVLAETHAEDAETSEAAKDPVKRGWLDWLRQIYAAPAVALLLLVIGYQNLVQYPALRQAGHRPQVLQWAAVNIGTWGSAGPVITIHPGEGFLLFVRIPPEEGYASYKADLFDPSGKLEWSLDIQGSLAQDHCSVRVPPAERRAGTYALAVRGISAAGESKEVGRASFDLQIQK